MIVCQCEVINDQQLTHAIVQGTRTVARACQATGAGRNCGSCIFTLKRLLCQHVADDQVAFVEVEGAAS